MNNIAIFGREFDKTYLPQIQNIFDTLSKNNCNISIYHSFNTYLKDQISLADYITTFSKTSGLPSDSQLLISIGGDGTILESATLMKDRDIPILGVNTGRLGFLSTVIVTEFSAVFNQILNNNYSVDNRSTLELTTESKLFGSYNFALNELVVHRKDTSSMIGIDVYIDNELLNTYWADGIIISTPTGSTAYSLSCGGPMLFPKAKNFIITPVSPHNLNSRPIVIPDDRIVKLRVKGRAKNFLVSLDSRMDTIDSDTTLTIKKGTKNISLLKLSGQSFIKTISQKLHWGIDYRN